MTVAPETVSPASPTPPAPNPTQSTQQALNASIDAALTSAPELTGSPGAAVDVASAGGNIPVTAQGVAQAGIRQRTANAADTADHQSGGLLHDALGFLGHDVVHPLGTVAGDLAKAANAPLRLVQHEYRYLHDVEARHGLLAALGEGLVIVGGVAAGSVLTGGLGDVALAGMAEGEGLVAALGTAASAATSATSGAVLGGEAATGGLGQVAYRDSWQRTGSSTYRDPHTGQLVSFGRDIASGLFGLKPGSGRYSDVSGVLDAVGDMFADPLSKAGNIGAEAHSLEGAHGLLGTVYGGNALTAENMERIAQQTWANGGVRRALQQIADMTPGEIVAYDSRLAPLVGDKVVTDEEPLANEIKMFRHDPVGEPVHTADHAVGAYYTPGVAGVDPSSYAARGANVTSAFGNLEGALRLGNESPEVYNAATAAISRIAGDGELSRLMAMSPGALRSHVEEAIGADIPGDADPLDYYGAWLARQEGHKALLYRPEGTGGYNHEFLALRPDAVRMPEGTVRLPGLGSASTPDEVMDVLRSHVRAAEYLGNKLPSMSFVRLPFARIREYMDNASGVVGTIGRMTTRIPGQALDPERLDFSGRELDPTSLDGVRDFYNMLRYGLGRRAAEEVVTNYVHADVASRVTIFRNAVLDTLMSMAGQPLRSEDVLEDPDALDSLVDPKTKQSLMDFMKDHTQFTEPDSGGVYGATTEGVATRHVVDADSGRDIGAGLMISQRGRLTIPDFVEARRMAQALEGGQRFTGTVDDFLYQHVTTNFFKKWVLQSLGYAQHIALAELIPNTLRLGFTTVARNALSSAAARLGYRAAQEDLGPMTGLMWRLLEHVPQNDRDAQRAATFVLATEGHAVTPGLAAGEYGADPTTVFRHGIEKVSMRPSDQFTLYGPEAERHLPEWQVWLRGIARDPMHRAAADAYLRAAQAGEDADRAHQLAQDAALSSLRSQSPETLSTMLRSKHLTPGAPAGADPLEDWAGWITENMKAAVSSGAEGHAPHIPLLSKVAAGDVPTLGELRDIDVIHRPLKVPGRILVPDSTPTLERIANLGFRKVLNPIVNFLARQPIALAEFNRAMDVLQPQIDAGLLSEDEAVPIALSRSTAEAIRYVHNVHDRTQFDQLMRNWAPFLFAQEQAYRRAARLLAENPGAFRRYQLMISGVHDMTVKQNDGQGNEYIAFPGAGWLGSHVPGALGVLGIPVASMSPAGFGGTLTSANVIFPLAEGFRPNLGPVAIVPAQLLDGMFAEIGKDYAGFQPIASKAQGALTEAIGTTAMSAPVWQQLIPNEFAYRVVETAMGSDRSFNSAMLETLQALDYQQNVAMSRWEASGRHGAPPELIPPPNASPLQLQDFVNRVKNQTRILFATRAILGLASPISADVTLDDYGLPQELSTAISQAGSVSKGVQEFLAAHPDATPYTTFQSTSTSGSSLPDSVEAQQWIDSNMGLINRYQYGAAWLMPQLKDTTYSAQVYNEQLAEGLRVKDTPMQFLQALYTTAGNSVYYSALTQHEQALADAANNSVALSAEYQRWDQYTQMLQAQMPIWASNFNSNQKLTNAQRSITELQEIFTTGQAPNTEQSALVYQLLSAYEQAYQQYQVAGQQQNYTTAQKQVRDAWEAQVDAFAQEYPQLAGVVQNVFRDALVTQVSI